jgi:hypothetical protein
MMSLRMRWYFGRINKALAAHRRLLERFGGATALAAPHEDQDLLRAVVRLEHRLQRLSDEGERLVVLGMANSRLPAMLEHLNATISTWREVEAALRGERQLDVA